MDVEKLHNEVLRAFNHSCVIATQQYSGRGFRPAADAYFEEDTREIVVRFDLAGMAMSDIERPRRPARAHRARRAHVPHS